MLNLELKLLWKTQNSQLKGNKWVQAKNSGSKFLGIEFPYNQWEHPTY